MIAAPEKSSNTHPDGRFARLVHDLLNLAPVLWVKGRARERVWRARAQTIRNPPLPPRVVTIVFVCLGNICRSPFAAHLAARRLADAGRPGIRSLSAGTSPSQAARSPEAACEAASRFGISLESHVPTALSEDLMDAADIVVVMEAGQMTEVQQAYPAHRDRVVLLSLFDPEAEAAFDRYHIADPFGHPVEVFDACYRRIDRAVAALLDSLPVEARAR